MARISKINETLAGKNVIRCFAGSALIFMAVNLQETTLQSYWDKLGHFSAIGLAFAIPISTALSSVLISLVITSWVLGPNAQPKRQIFLHHPLLLWIYPLVFCALIGTTYSLGDPHVIRSSLVDSLRLLFIPFLIYFYQSPKTARAALWAFAAAMVLTLILAFLKVYGGLPIGLKYPAGAIFKSYIKTSFFMAVSAYFLAIQWKYRTKRHRIVLSVVIALMIYYLLFMNVGRIGYISLVTFLLLFAWQTSRLKGILLASLGVLMLLAGAYVTSPHFSHRVQVLAHDLDLYHAGKLLESSLGSRLQFAQSSLSLMTQQPFLGWGTGSFPAAYAQWHEGETTLLTDNPHNEFLRTGVELGAVGLGFLLLLFYQQWRLSGRLLKEIRHFWQGVLLTFILGCLLNSWLKDSAEGYFYCLMSAICFASLPLTQKQLAPKAVLS